jgi:hypothetical protein
MVDNIGRYVHPMLKETSYKRVRADFRVNNGHCRNYSSLIPPLGYGLDGPRIQTRWRRDFPRPSKPALGPTQPPVQLVPGLYPKVKRPGCGVDHPPPSSTEVKERAQLYLYSSYGPVWQLAGWTFMYPQDARLLTDSNNKISSDIWYLIEDLSI